MSNEKIVTKALLASLIRNQLVRIQNGSGELGIKLAPRRPTSKVATSR